MAECGIRRQIRNPQSMGSGSSTGRAAGLYPASTRSVRDPSSNLGRSMKNFGLWNFRFWIDVSLEIQNRKSKIDGAASSSG